MHDVEGCFACDLIAGRHPLPGGRIHRTRHWIVEHCVGRRGESPLGIGTLLVKPERHVVHVADLDDDETAELGPLLRDAARVVTRVTKPEQVYACLWSHGPVHVHFVVQPVDNLLMERHGAHGPMLQVAQFESEPHDDRAAVEAFATAARAEFSRL